MGNSVIGVGNYVIARPLPMGNFLIADNSPELNPDEWVWKNVKHDRIGKTNITSADDLTGKAEQALLRLQQLPQLVRAFFSDPDLSYITT